MSKLLILLTLVKLNEAGVDLTHCQSENVCVAKENGQLLIYERGVLRKYYGKEVEEANHGDHHGDGDFVLAGVHPCDAPKSEEFKWGNVCGENVECTPIPSTLNYSCDCLNPNKMTKHHNQCSISNAIYIVHFQLLITIVVMATTIVLYLNRRNKIIGMFSIYLMISAGAIVTNWSIVFKLIDFKLNCVLYVWFKEIGFVFFSGPIVLRLYRSFVEFRTRKAHRWVVREKDILKYQFTMATVVVYYLMSWTVDNVEIGGTCPFNHWHYVSVVGELIFLFIGLNLSWHLKNSTNIVVPYERYYLTVALVIQVLARVAELVIRQLGLFEIWAQFVFVHVTTVCLFVLVVPKLYYICTESTRTRAETRTEMKATIKERMLDANDLDFSEININDMDPQDIRYELKRVYTQLEVLRGKTMRRDNPHISKRRGGRKPTHRRFSLQKRGSRDKQTKSSNQMSRQRSVRYNLDNDLEDSICSIEGPSTYSEAR